MDSDTDIPAILTSTPIRHSCKRRIKCLHFEESDTSAAWSVPTDKSADTSAWTPPQEKQH